jgi:hypothetical protein
MAGYSGTPLVKKLGIKSESEVLLVSAPDGYRHRLDPLPPAVRFVSRLSKSTDVIHFFSAQRAELERALGTFRKKMKPTTAIWVSWPKKSSKVPTDITEDTVREVALPMGLVDVKVCAVDDIWSGLKLVVRMELR